MNDPKLRPPTPEQHAREMMDLPPEWKVMMWKVVGPPARSTGVTMTGAVMREVFTRGPRKGELSWAKRDRDTELTFTIPHKLHDQWLDQWERETGRCRGCNGSGQEWAGWSETEGTKKRTCRRCNGEASQGC